MNSCSWFVFSCISTAWSWLLDLRLEGSNAADKHPSTWRVCLQLVTFLWCQHGACLGCLHCIWCTDIVDQPLLFALSLSVGRPEQGRVIHFSTEEGVHSCEIIVPIVKSNYWWNCRDSVFDFSFSFILKIELSMLHILHCTPLHEGFGWFPPLFCFVFSYAASNPSRSCFISWQIYVMFARFFHSCLCSVIFLV